MEITGSDYHVRYEPEVATVFFSGTLRLSGTLAYEPIAQLLNDAAEQRPNLLTLDLRGLDFLNSSGINVLFRFVIRMRDQQTMRIVVRGTAQVPWQNKSLPNLQRLLPELQLIME